MSPADDSAGIKGSLAKDVVHRKMLATVASRTGRDERRKIMMRRLADGWVSPILP
jgi:hypothetical protein